MDMAEETLVALFEAGATVLTERFVSPDDPVRNRDPVDVAVPDFLTRVRPLF